MKEVREKEKADGADHLQSEMEHASKAQSKRKKLDKDKARVFYGPSTVQPASLQQAGLIDRAENAEVALGEYTPTLDGDGVPTAQTCQERPRRPGGRSDIELRSTGISPLSFEHGQDPHPTTGLI